MLNSPEPHISPLSFLDKWHHLACPLVWMLLFCLFSPLHLTLLAPR